MNVWVEGIDKTLAELDKNEIENNYNEAKREFDVSKCVTKHSSFSPDTSKEYKFSLGFEMRDDPYCTSRKNTLELI